MNRVDDLIAGLQDRRLDFGDRHDIAGELGAYDDGRVVAVLARVASDPDEDIAIQDMCGEALGEIWCRLGRYEIDLLMTLQPPARRLLEGMFERCRPEWVQEVRHIWARTDR